MKELNDYDSLVLIEHNLLAANIIALCSGICTVALTFSEYWLAKDIKYFGFALGLPSLSILLYWGYLKQTVSVK